MEKFKVPFNDYLNDIKNLKLTKMISDMKVVVENYELITGVQFDTDLAFVEIIPSKSNIRVIMPAVKEKTNLYIY